MFSISNSTFVFSNARISICIFWRSWVDNFRFFAQHGLMKQGPVVVEQEAVVVGKVSVVIEILVIVVLVEEV